MMRVNSGVGVVLRLPPLDLDRAIDDLRQGAGRAELWRALSSQDIRLRYRRSIVGPFWVTISMGAMVAGLGLLYAMIFRQPVEEYLPYLALGLIAWAFLSMNLTDGCNAFISGERFIKQLPAPLSIHIYRILWRNFILSAHNLVVYIVVAVIFRIWPGWGLLQIIPGLFLVVAITASSALFLGLVSARFRDIPPIVASLLQFFFFLTPVFWNPALLPDRLVVVTANPFFHMVEVLRAPLLGQAVGLQTWLVLIGLAIFSWSFTLLFFAFFRRRVAYWI